MYWPVEGTSLSLPDSRSFSLAWNWWTVDVALSYCEVNAIWIITVNWRWQAVEECVDFFLKSCYQVVSDEVILTVWQQTIQSVTQKWGAYEAVTRDQYKAQHTVCSERETVWRVTDLCHKTGSALKQLNYSCIVQRYFCVIQVVAYISICYISICSWSVW